MLGALLDSPLFVACDRAFLFAAAARAIAKSVAEQVRTHDDGWLEDAERFLLGDSHSRPQRPSRDPRFARLLVISNEDPDSFAPVEVSARGLEIAGPRVLIALPEPRDLAAVERTNADVWLTSTNGAEPHEHHHAVAPPDLKENARVLCLSLTEREFKIADAPPRRERLGRTRLARAPVACAIATKVTGMTAVPALGPREVGKVALFGGSFNPPHLSHAMVAMSILAATDIDELWVLPCADHPFGKGLAPFEDRVEMCCTSFAAIAGVHVVRIEAEQTQPNYTVQTLRAIKAARPDLELSWVVGSDIVPELHLWRDPAALATLCEMLLVPREGTSLEEDAKVDGLVLNKVLEMPIAAISSTEIRARIARGDDVSGLVHREVAAMVSARGLYLS